ncbi:transposase family protein [Legionella oakridgensis]|uniref:transposase family protein n=1 Tax=Legionella oakridgensis TaxID=29423 RepID=UPI0003DE702C|nr:DDE_Tnp_1-associated protein [Legionella oakridgensis RV-2-2007]
MSFIDYFSEIPDPRQDINVKHNLLDVIFLTITAVISGCEGWKDIYDFGRVKMPHNHQTHYHRKQPKGALTTPPSGL